MQVCHAHHFWAAKQLYISDRVAKYKTDSGSGALQGMPSAGMIS